ncbi:MAG: hypothetical protein RL190_363, partial [Actinomycetota bacterium]
MNAPAIAIALIAAVSFEVSTVVLI